MNVPDVMVITVKGTKFIVAVSSGAPDRFPGSYWYLYDIDGKTLGYGQTKGWDGQGAGSALRARDLARAAARRRLRRTR